MMVGKPKYELHLVVLGQVLGTTPIHACCDRAAIAVIEERHAKAAPPPIDGKLRLMDGVRLIKEWDTPKGTLQ